MKLRSHTAIIVSGHPTPTTRETPMRIARLLAAVAIAALVLTAAGVSAPAGAATTQANRPGAATPTTVNLQLWYLGATAGPGGHAGVLWPTRRTIPHTVATSRAALDQLAVGPTAAERAAGLYTLVAPGTLPGITINNGTAIVTGTAAFFTGSVGTVLLRQAQVVYTLTQFPTVSRVQFVNPGIEPSAPVTRDFYASSLPPVVVYTPLIGQRVTSPVTVSGTANVHEGTVQVRILDSAGRQVARTFTTATCGSGCRGTYSVAVPFATGCSGGTQPGTIEVFAESQVDGSAIHVIRVPVTLAG